MSGDKDLEVDPAAIRKITEGLRGAVAELREIGTAGGASMGAGFGELSMTGMESGHSGLAGDFEDFCERWEWGVRGLVQDAGVLAAQTGIAAGALWEEDQYLQGAFKVGANAVYGNPHANEGDIEKKAWGEVFSADVYQPDYSGESFRKADQDMDGTWSDTGDKLGSEGWIGSLKDLADGGDD
ncbi:hypothetical protein [Streptomyces sp. FIT100]|uniref:hypothetical protein n=1 Tax=Streptomyces sp. FIT100 TaxID=2837956 RepID=UPI0021C6580E|nr:hypothetical protein [Streptomyces sp. FIT100]UUN27460.1 hypothetical protein KK483_14420 [Streptomyces sp. FIT100]